MSTRLLAIVVAIIVIIASLIIVVIYEEMNSKPEAADLILSPQDLGDGWVGFDKGTVNIPSFPNVTSSCFRQVQNTTIGVELILYVFNSANDSRAAYDELNTLYKTSEDYANFSFLSIGDGLFYYEYGNYPGSNLLVGKTMTMLWIDHEHFNLEPWFKKSILDTANLQAEKINREFAG